MLKKDAIEIISDKGSKCVYQMGEVMLLFGVSKETVEKWIHNHNFTFDEHQYQIKIIQQTFTVNKERILVQDENGQAIIFSTKGAVIAYLDTTEHFYEKALLKGVALEKDGKKFFVDYALDGVEYA